MLKKNINQVKMIPRRAVRLDRFDSNYLRPWISTAPFCYTLFRDSIGLNVRSSLLIFCFLVLIKNLITYEPFIFSDRIDATLHWRGRVRRNTVWPTRFRHVASMLRGSLPTRNIRYTFDATIQFPTRCSGVVFYVTLKLCLKINTM